MIYCLEMRNTGDWSDCRYREYTNGQRRAERFKKVSRIQFSDSGHGIIPVVTECKSRGCRGPEIDVLSDHVRETMAPPEPPPKRTSTAQRIAEAVAEEREACARVADAIANSPNCYDFEGITKGTAAGIAERIRERGKS